MLAGKSRIITSIVMSLACIVLVFVTSCSSEQEMTISDADQQEASKDLPGPLNIDDVVKGEDGNQYRITGVCAHYVNDSDEDEDADEDTDVEERDGSDDAEDADDGEPSDIFQIVSEAPLYYEANLHAVADCDELELLAGLDTEIEVDVAGEEEPEEYVQSLHVTGIDRGAFAHAESCKQLTIACWTNDLALADDEDDGINYSYDFEAMKGFLANSSVEQVRVWTFDDMFFDYCKGLFAPEICGKVVEVIRLDQHIALDGDYDFTPAHLTQYPGLVYTKATIKDNTLEVTASYGRSSANGSDKHKFHFEGERFTFSLTEKTRYGISGGDFPPLTKRKFIKECLNEGSFWLRVYVEGGIVTKVTYGT